MLEEVVHARRTPAEDVLREADVRLEHLQLVGVAARCAGGGYVRAVLLYYILKQTKSIEELVSDHADEGFQSQYHFVDYFRTLLMTTDRQTDGWTNYDGSLSLGLRNPKNIKNEKRKNVRERDIDGDL